MWFPKEPEEGHGWGLMSEPEVSSGMVILLPLSFQATLPPAQPGEWMSAAGLLAESRRPDDPAGASHPLGCPHSQVPPAPTWDSPPLPLGSPGHRPRLRSRPWSVVLMGTAFSVPSRAQMTVLTDLSHEHFRPLCGATGLPALSVKTQMMPLQVSARPGLSRGDKLAGTVTEPWERAAAREARTVVPSFPTSGVTAVRVCVCACVCVCVCIPPSSPSSSCALTTTCLWPEECQISWGDWSPTM